MKNITCFFLVLVTLSLKAQNSGLVEYKVKIEGNDFKEFTGILKFNSFESVFISNCPFNNYSVLSLIDSLQPRNVMKLNINQTSTPNSFYFDVKKGEIISFETVLDSMFITVEKAKNLTWVKTSDTKIIGSYKCKKATCEFRGRSYEAWYAEDIKQSFGPWKLNGLPGLIVETYDKDRKIHFLLTSINYPISQSFSISSPFIAVKRINLQLFDKRRTNYFIKFLSAPRKIVPSYKPVIDYSKNTEKVY